MLIKLWAVVLILFLMEGASAQTQAPMVPFGGNPTAQNGTSQFIFNSWASQFWSLYEGTSGSPITVAGPLFKVSKTEQIASSTCNNNAVDPECSASATFYNVGTATDGMQVVAAFGGAQGSGSKDAVGLYGIGRTVGSGTGIGTGGYFDGRRDTTTGNNLGAEVRSENVTASAESWFSTGFNNGGLWITASGNSKSACGACVGNAGQAFDAAFGVTSSAAITWAFVSPGFSVDPSGNLTALSYTVGATAGVSCSGAPTASFAVINGIVTHC